MPISGTPSLSFDHPASHFGQPQPSQVSLERTGSERRILGVTHTNLHTGCILDFHGESSAGAKELTTDIPYVRIQGKLMQNKDKEGL